MNGWWATGVWFAGALLSVLLARSAMRFGAGRGWPTSLSLGLGTLVLVAGGLAWGWFQRAQGQMDWLAQWQGEFGHSISVSLGLYRQWGWDEAELVRVERWLRLLSLDGFFGWLVLLASGLAFWIYAGLLRAPWALAQGRRLPTFSRWSIPEAAIWFLMAALLLVSALARWALAYRIGLNALIVLTCGYGLNGLAIVFFELERRQVSNFWKVLAVLLIGLIPAWLIVIVLLGIIDTWWDPRKLRAPLQPSDETPRQVL